MITSEVLEHIPDDTGALAELVRVLRARRRVRGDGADVAAREDQLDAVRRVPRAGRRRRARAHLLGDRAKAKLRAAGLRLAGSHHAHALHSPYWWLKCAVGVNDDDHPLVAALPAVPRVGHRRAARGSTRVAERVLSPVLGKSLVLYGAEQAAGERDAR